ncbi:mechanosensitive ion channel domain-containing protein, partial [Francisella tularensis]|uniref:mechanosensitive ion channel domain-containing protein n=1 Tax=Francisella tularensis TaxID=263 RepID=UPI002381AD2B
MLVFKDTILGFVTNVQVAALDVVRVVDWITIPSANVDGTVMDVSINTLKIRNFDKTISMITTYTLNTHSVQNWRGMVEN